MRFFHIDSIIHYTVHNIIQEFPTQAYKNTTKLFFSNQKEHKCPYARFRYVFRLRAPQSSGALQNKMTTWTPFDWLFMFIINTPCFCQFGRKFLFIVISLLGIQWDYNKFWDYVKHFGWNITQSVNVLSFFFKRQWAEQALFSFLFGIMISRFWSIGSQLHIFILKTKRKPWILLWAS